MHQKNKVTTENKTMLFEGAGWADADSSKATDVTNCRIRGTFLNDKREKFYIELTGHEVGRYSVSSLQKAGIKHALCLSHLFYTVDHKRHWSPDVSQKVEPMEYTKANILKLVNERMGCSFTDLKVINDDPNFSGFSHTGLAADDFHNDQPDLSEYQGYTNRQTWCTALTIDQNKDANKRARLYATNDDTARAAELLEQYCRMHLKTEMYEMAPWAWDNCAPEFPSMVDWVELIKQYRDGAVETIKASETYKATRKKPSKDATIERAAESVINGQFKQARQQLKTVSLRTLVISLARLDLPSDVGQKLINIKVGA